MIAGYQITLSEGNLDDVIHIFFEYLLWARCCSERLNAE